MALESHKHNVSPRTGDAETRSSLVADAARPSTRAERLVRAIAAKVNSQAAVINQSRGAVKLTAHPRDTGFEVELDVKL